MSKKNNRTAIIAVAILLVLVVDAIIVWFATRPAAPEAGRATIVVSVTHGDGSEKEFTISTDAENLRGALEQENLIAGDESEYGLYVKTVDGETLDFNADGMYWAFYINGEYAMTGVDQTPIEEGAAYSFVATKG